MDGSILDNLHGYCDALFRGAILYIDENVTKFNLQDVTSCANMFNACRLYKKSSNEGHTYGISDRKFIEVILPNSCSNYSYMFYNSSVLSDLPALRSSAASNLNYMYQGCVIDMPNLELPANYFQICKNNLSQVRGMFRDNSYITTL